MLSRKTIEAYLFFLLRHRLAVSVVVAVLTVLLSLSMWFRMHVFTNFSTCIRQAIRTFSCIPSTGSCSARQHLGHGGGGTERQDDLQHAGDRQKIDRITLDLLHDIPGVTGEAGHVDHAPKLKTTLTSGSGIKVVPLIYPRIPEDQEDLEFLRQKVYTTEEARKFFVSEDDKATLIVAGFWEEYFDLPGMWRRSKPSCSARKPTAW